MFLALRTCVNALPVTEYLSSIARRLALTAVGRVLVAVGMAFGALLDLAPGAAVDGRAAGYLDIDRVRIGTRDRTAIARPALAEVFRAAFGAATALLRLSQEVRFAPIGMIMVTFAETFRASPNATRRAAVRWSALGEGHVRRIFTGTGFITGLTDPADALLFGATRRFTRATAIDLVEPLFAPVTGVVIAVTPAPRAGSNAAA